MLNENLQIVIETIQHWEKNDPDALIGLLDWYVSPEGTCEHVKTGMAYEKVTYAKVCQTEDGKIINLYV